MNKSADKLFCILLLVLATISFVQGAVQDERLLQEVLFIKGWVALLFSRYVSKTLGD
jgi:hypothetical protein